MNRPMFPRHRTLRLIAVTGEDHGAICYAFNKMQAAKLFKLAYPGGRITHINYTTCQP